VQLCPTRLLILGGQPAARRCAGLQVRHLRHVAPSRSRWAEPRLWPVSRMIGIPYTWDDLEATPFSRCRPWGRRLTCAVMTAEAEEY
jgi:hypothetical protein